MCFWWHKIWRNINIQQQRKQKHRAKTVHWDYSFDDDDDVDDAFVALSLIGITCSIQWIFLMRTFSVECVTFNKSMHFICLLRNFCWFASFSHSFFSFFMKFFSFVHVPVCLWLCVSKLEIDTYRERKTAAIVWRTTITNFSGFYWCLQHEFPLYT